MICRHRPGQQSIDRLMDLYAIRDPFLPVLKEACRLRGIAASSTGTFPCPTPRWRTMPASWLSCIGRVSERHKKVSRLPQWQAGILPEVAADRCEQDFLP